MTRRYRVVLHPEAETELNALYDAIVEKVGAATAWTFVSGIRDFCSKLSDFPERGTERVELVPGCASSDIGAASASPSSSKRKL